jgi:hypothetical protein
MAKTFRIKGQVGGRFAQMIAVDDSRTYQYVQLLLKGSMNEYVLLRIAQTIYNLSVRATNKTKMQRYATDREDPHSKDAGQNKLLFEVE